MHPTHSPLTPRTGAAARAAAAALLALLLTACAGPGTAPSSTPTTADTFAHTAQAQAAVQRYLERARQQAVTHDAVTVSVAALREDEVQASLGLPLAKVGVQPVWVKIDNRSAHSRWLLPVFLDRDYYSAREVAHLLNLGGDDKARLAATQKLVDGEIKSHVLAGESASGFVYTNLARGIKLINIELLGANGLQRYDFARVVPSGRFDYEQGDAAKAYPADQQRPATVPALGPAFAQMSCCTTNAAGTEQGDPLNLVMVGAQHDVLVALVRAGWDFTETTDASSVGQMVKSFVFGGEYRTSPVSPLYFDGRAQDFAMQRARRSISQRNHLRLWITPLTVEGEPLWIGQVSRDIGVKLTRRSPTFTTHVIDPNVDEAREYLFQSLLLGGNIARWGLAPGVGAATREAPRVNLGDDPYFTDGQRMVIFISKTPRAVGDAQYLKWPMKP